MDTTSKRSSKRYRTCLSRSNLEDGICESNVNRNIFDNQNEVLDLKEEINSLEEISKVVNSKLQLSNEILKDISLKNEIWMKLKSNSNVSDSATVVLNIGGKLFDIYKSSILFFEGSLLDLLINQDQWTPDSDGFDHN
jgi:hypothetical protein